MVGEVDKYREPGRRELARIESAVKAVLAAGLRTPDIWSEGTKKVGTREMGEAVVASITKKTTKG